MEEEVLTLFGNSNTQYVVNMLLGLDLTFIIIAAVPLLVHMMAFSSYSIPLNMVSYFHYGLVIRDVIVYPIGTQFFLLLMFLFLVFITPAIVLSWILSFFVSLGRVRGYKQFSEDWRSIKYSFAEAPKKLRLLVYLIAVIVIVLYLVIVLVSYFTFHVSFFGNITLYRIYFIFLVLFLTGYGPIISLNMVLFRKILSAFKTG